MRICGILAVRQRLFYVIRDFLIFCRQFYSLKNIEGEVKSEVNGNKEFSEGWLGVHY